MVHRRAFVTAAVLSALHFLGVIALSTSLVMFVNNPHLWSTRAVLLSLLFTGMTWVLSYFKRREALCPLCKGTPLMNSGALPHVHAVRVRPLNHGVTAVASIISSQQFCCMYCGTDFDLLKHPQHLRPESVGQAAVSYTHSVRTCKR